MYGGDATPKDEDKLPPMSDFLTVQDTMKYLCHAYKDDDGDADPKEILEDEELLKMYYSEDLIPLVKKTFRTPDTTATDPFALGINLPFFNME